MSDKPEITPEKLAELDALDAKRTPGPYVAPLSGYVVEDTSGQRRGVADCRSQSGDIRVAEADAAYIVAACNALPALVREVERLCGEPMSDCKPVSELVISETERTSLWALVQDEKADDAIHEDKYAPAVTAGYCQSERRHRGAGNYWTFWRVTWRAVWDLLTDVKRLQQRLAETEVNAARYEALRYAFSYDSPAGWFDDEPAPEAETDAIADAMMQEAADLRARARARALGCTVEELPERVAATEPEGSTAGVRGLRLDAPTSYGAALDEAKAAGEDVSAPTRRTEGSEA